MRLVGSHFLPPFISLFFFWPRFDAWKWRPGTHLPSHQTNSPPNQKDQARRLIHQNQTRIRPGHNPDLTNTPQGPSMEFGSTLSARVLAWISSARVRQLCNPSRRRLFRFDSTELRGLFSDFTPCVAFIIFFALLHSVAGNANIYSSELPVAIFIILRENLFDLCSPQEQFIVSSCKADLFALKPSDPSVFGIFLNHLRELLNQASRRSQIMALRMTKATLDTESDIKVSCRIPFKSVNTSVV